MKVVFFLDNNEYVEVAPEKLQIRQVTSGVAALGTEVVVPLKKENGTPDLDENGQQKTQLGFRPFINYQVNLTIPTDEQSPAALSQPQTDVVASATTKVTKSKGTKAKRRAN